MKRLTTTINWFEIPVTDMGRALAFYEAIFETTLTVMPLGESLVMAFFPVEAGAVGGALCWKKSFYRPSSDGVVLYFAADPDISAMMARVSKAGGKAIMNKKQIAPGAGSMAMFLDTEGNRIALYETEQ